MGKTVTRGNSSPSEREDQARSRKVAEARETVARQVTALLESRATSTTRGDVVRAMRGVLEAAATRSRPDMRAAAMDLSVTAAAWCLAMDVRR